LTGVAGRALANAEVFAGEIAILESQPSVRLHWMLDSAEDGKTWVRRFGSYEREHSSSQAARLSWIRLLQDLGYAFRFVSPEELRNPQPGVKAPRVLILPSALALSDRTVTAIVRFANAGGLVLADETPARYDHRLARRPRPALEGFFGIERAAGGDRFLRNGRFVPGTPRTPAGLPLCETGLAPEGLTVARRLDEVSSRADATPAGVATQARSRAGHWCQFERTVGRGRTVLLNLGVAEYARSRLVESQARGCRDLRARIRRLLDKHQVREIALARVARYPSILERVLLTKGASKVLVVRVNCLESRSLFQSLTGRGNQPMTLVLPLAVRVRDLWSGEELGRGRQVEVTLDPLRGSFFLLEEI
jgi:hypothetical protein